MGGELEEVGVMFPFPAGYSAAISYFYEDFVDLREKNLIGRRLESVVL